MEGPAATWLGAAYDHRVFPVLTSNANICDLSVPTKATPGTALTGAKTLPSTSMVHSI